MPPVILFVHGTLLDAGVLARVSGQPALARRLRPARLDGWRRVFLRGTPYPTLVPAAGAVMEGAVLRVGAVALAELIVVTDRGALRARAWIAPPWRADRTRDYGTARAA